MNTPITRLYIVFLLLFGVLIVGTSWNTVFRADELRDKPQNRRQLLEQQRIRRGAIRADDGSVLARSVRQSDDTFTRLYPQNGLFAQAIGYSFTRYGRAGLEQSRNEALTGTTNELGLLGAAAVICTYLLAVERGFKIAVLARDSFSKLLATGLTAVFALQVFVIVGGVTQVIPLTGVTLPFISYGGSSILANFVLLALLLLVSERARADAEAPT